MLESIDFEEKAWFMKKNNDEIILGIGRPRCGFLGIDNENKILHNQTKGNSPVNMGIKTNTGFLLGHSDGTITEMNGKVCKYIQCGNDSFGMWTYGFAFPILMVKNIDYLIFEIFKKMNLMSVF